MESTLAVQEQYDHVRNHCGYFFLEDWSFVGCSGKDIFTYLQTQTTNDVFELNIGTGQNSAIVDRKGKFLASFSIHKIQEHSILFLVEKSQQTQLVNHLDSFIFREDIQLDVEVQLNCLLTIQGPKSALLIKKLFPDVDLPAKSNDVQISQWEEHEAVLINKSLTSEDGFIIAFPNTLKAKIEEKINQEGNTHQLIGINPETREILRIEAGIPLYPKDIDNSHVLPETGLEHSSVSYNKGCYIGQEVIARIKTYGSPAFALMGLVFDGYELPSYNSEIKLGNQKIGILKSTTYSYSLEKYVALAYIHKDHRSPDLEFNVKINQTPFNVKTALLPFHQAHSRSDHAKRLHEEAMQHFKDEENLDRPITLLREAIELDPKFAIAYEALGVMLSKQDKLDEAIALMKRLVEINPNEIMAHTNLSIYYMKQGRIEDAEQEKGEATAIQFEAMMADKIAQKNKQKQEEGKKQDQERKMGMFLEVLKIDSNDQVANFGLGAIYLDTGKFDEALPHLESLVKHYPDYSVAYNLLGKTLEKLSRYEEALEVYKKGIATASKKGDLMPLKEMQTRQNQLLHSNP